MSEPPPLGRCATCAKTLTTTHQAFALQHHSVAYTRRGDTPSNQAHLTLSATTIKATFCTSNCCKVALGSCLEAQGLPASVQHHRVHGGPIHPCAHCAKPVNMTQPHGAWVRCEQTVAWDGEDWIMVPDWFDVLAAVCAHCAGLAAKAQRSIRRMSERARQGA